MSFGSWKEQDRSKKTPPLVVSAFSKERKGMSEEGDLMLRDFPSCDPCNMSGHQLQRARLLVGLPFVENEDV